jgi:ParB-like chromosome segregation protein Spo0J
MHKKSKNSRTLDTVTAGAKDANGTAVAGGAHDSPVKIKLCDLTIHRFNRSFEIEPNQRHIDRLASSIGVVKLLHPITLVPIKGQRGRFAIVSGANRYWAIVRERGRDGYLEPGEFVIRWDLDSEDKDCIAIAMEENAERLDMSPAAMAKYVARLHEEEDEDQETLGNELGVRREFICALCSLPKYWDQLPASWKRDLQFARGDAEQGPVITASHWRHVAAKVKKANGVTDDLRRIMEQASSEEWSSEKLRRALNVSEDDGEDTGDTGEGSSPSCNNVTAPLAGCAPMGAGGPAGSPVAAAPAVPAKKGADKGAKAASTAKKGRDKDTGAVSTVKPTASSRLDREDIVDRLVVLRGEADQDRAVMAILDKAIADIKALAKKPETRAAA